MKSRRRHMRAIRSLALTGCVVASLATPALAGAMPIGGPGHPQSQPAAQPQSPTLYHNHGRPAVVAGAHYEGSVLVGASQSSPKAPYTAPDNFKGSDIASLNPSSTSSQPSSVVVHEVRTVNSNDHTLAIVLASSALGIALCGTAFAAVRLTRIQRRALS